MVPRVHSHTPDTTCGNDECLVVAHDGADSDRLRNIPQARDAFFCKQFFQFRCTTSTKAPWMLR
jgi:hypothetical protein